MAKINKSNTLYQEDLDFVLSTKGIEMLRDKIFLITGASGLIGVCLIDALMKYNKQGANIVIYAVGRDKNKSSDRLGEYYDDYHFHFLEQDVRQALPEDIKFDFIIPLASNTHPLAYSQYPIETIEINIKGIEHALQKAVQDDAIVLYPSTVEIYGNASGDELFTEDYTGHLQLDNARSCYTESKRLSEALCQSFIAERNANVKIIRLSRVFGPTMLLSDTKASSQFIVKALQKENIVLKSKGEQFFSYTYVADAVAGMLYVLLHGKIGVSYNIACDKCNIHLKEFASLCAKYVGRNVIYELPSEAEKKGFSIASHAILDTKRLASIGFVCKYDIENAISRTLSILCQ